MIDGIDSNRKKWEELCSSYRQARRASMSNQSTEQSEAHRNGKEEAISAEDKDSVTSWVPAGIQVRGTATLKCQLIIQ